MEPRKWKWLLFLCLLIGKGVSAEALPHRTFGDPADPCIVFLHGGPGYNAATFEIGIADSLAERGYFVISYDRRGSGRSEEAGKKAAYTFDEAIADLRDLLSQYEVEKVHLIGHSFGGAVGIRYAERYPQQVESLILVGAPLDYPETFRSIQDKCADWYTANDTSGLKYMEMLQEMDPTVLPYATYSFMHAMKCGLYSPKSPTPEALALREQMGSDSLIHLAAKSTFPPVQGFHRNEQYTSLNLYKSLKKLRKKVKVTGIFGEDDGLFNDTQLAVIRKLLKDRYHLIRNASHSVFLDRPDAFLESIEAAIPVN